MRTTLLVAILLAAGQPQAAPPCDQSREPLSAALRQAYEGAIRDLVHVADVAPAEIYDFRPVPGSRSLGAQLAHTSDVMRMDCALAAGSKEAHGESVETTWKTKADVTSSLQGARHYCDGVYRLMTDARALQHVEAGPAVPRVRLLIANVAHIRQHYGNVRTYLRLNGITPPATERLPAPKTPDW